jgi:DNA-binding CsgD family transcriptional regulator
MAYLGRAALEVLLSSDERETLERWARRPTSAQALALRCRIVLLCAEGLSNIDVADRLGVNRATAGRWRNRFIEGRLDGLHDEPRPGAPRTIGDDDVEAVIVKTLEESPSDATHWSTRSMANSKRLFVTGRNSGTMSPSPLSGTRLPMRSSTPWLTTARGSPTQVTRSRNSRHVDTSVDP